MALPVVNHTFRLCAEPEMKFGQSGAAVMRLRLAANANRKNQDTGDWEKSDELFINATAFGPHAEAIAEANLTTGQEVLVSGRLRTNSWEDQDGNKRSVVEMRLDSIGPTIRPPRQGGNGQSQQRGGYGQQGGTGQPGDGDPWAGGGAGFGGSGDAAPF
ncbi:single-strand DNA-binding protein [Lipingzhangella halophila]|uniref:Single-stranded DNA-binding protein n=1 Tax=Lipingzhangella halophila TaxID=1783352 RepID=A0A7W7RH65_9ACTN|nr:single-stranded DNA-binding protein [Lipingzhangella halophila]MBB4931820.1 single-strand DNA-binding protein [Lipingzhangella halophila]